MNFKVNRPKTKRLEDFYLRFGRVIFKNKKVSYLIRKNRFEIKNVIKTLERRLKVPEKFLVIKWKKIFEVVVVSEDRENIDRSLDISKKISKFASKKYMLDRKYHKLFINAVDLKIVKKEPTENEDITEVQKEIEQEKLEDEPNKKITHSKKIRWFDCFICIKKFKTRKELGCHIERRHVNESSEVQCDYCGKYSKSKEAVLRHMIKHVPEHELTCKICGVSLMTKELLEIHLYRHPICNFKCQHPNCRRSFLKNRELKKHQESHQSKPHFKCLIKGCKRNFKCRAGLRNHKTSHNNVNLLKCSKCKSVFRSKFWLTRHMENVHGENLAELLMIKKQKQQKIQQEVKLLADKDPLWYKKLSVDEIIAKTPYTIVGNDKSIECIICNKILNFRYLIKKHIQSLHLITAFQCDYCAKFFNLLGNLRDHMFLHTDKFECPECGRRFVHSSALRVHRLTHDFDQKVKCPECNKIYKNRKLLLEHQKRKAAKLNFKCPLENCMKVFKLESYLKVHLKRHENKIDYICHEEGCGQIFVCDFNLKRHHAARHQPVVPKKFDCAACGASFRLKGYLTQHHKTKGHTPK